MFLVVVAASLDQNPPLFVHWANMFVNRVLFRPPQCDRYDFPGEVSRLKTPLGNTISAVFLRRSSKTTVTLLYSHENGEDLNTSFRFLKKLSSCLKVNIMAYDYSGYGESTGTTKMVRLREWMELACLPFYSQSVAFSILSRISKRSQLLC